MLQGSGTKYASRITQALGRPLFCLKANSRDNPLSYLPRLYLDTYKHAHEISPENALKKINTVFKNKNEKKKNFKEKNILDYLQG